MPALAARQVRRSESPEDSTHARTQQIEAGEQQTESGDGEAQRGQTSTASDAQSRPQRDGGQGEDLDRELEAQSRDQPPGARGSDVRPQYDAERLGERHQSRTDESDRGDDGGTGTLDQRGGRRTDGRTGRRTSHHRRQGASEGRSRGEPQPVDKQVETQEKETQTTDEFENHAGP